MPGRGVGLWGWELPALMLSAVLHTSVLLPPFFSRLLSHVRQLIRAAADLSRRDDQVVREKNKPF